ncbi:hypothetical protein PMIN01_06253 [Paraphaeosphaeria minitans]|uniref:Uncharacterized protein n=1 Tax=Paraphaeosphaeria minitans TaxID=565426 RepID=A0A9P6GIH9_9PLEO|nr:hypothetical protein PMIN01_06253 [Paraphaeosphaeria minitans]
MKYVQYHDLEAQVFKEAITVTSHVTPRIPTSASVLAQHMAQRQQRLADPQFQVVPRSVFLDTNTILNTNKMELQRLLSAAPCVPSAPAGDRRLEKGRREAEIESDPGLVSVGETRNDPFGTVVLHHAQSMRQGSGLRNVVVLVLGKDHGGNSWPTGTLLPAAWAKH